MSERLTRDRAIAHHIALALKHTELTRESYGDDVVRIYHERTPLHLRHVEFHLQTRGADPYAVLRANAQLLFRQIDGVVRLASEIEEALVLALPEPFRGACLRELAARYGLLAASQPAEQPAGQVSQLGGLSREFGEALQALSKTMDDARLDHADALHAAEVVAQLDDLIAAATTVRAAHSAVLSSAPALRIVNDKL
jgi:hypothetical protein